MESETVAGNSDEGQNQSYGIVFVTQRELILILIINFMEIIEFRIE